MADPQEVKQEQTVRLAPFQEDFLADIFATVKGLTGEGTQMPFAEQKLADLSQGQKQAILSAFEGVGSFQPFLQKGAEAVGQGIGTIGTGLGTIGSAIDQTAGATYDFDPRSYQQFMDPFLEDTIATTQADIARQGDIQRGKIGAGAVSQGAFGGSRLGVREALTDAEIARAGSDLRRQAGREALEFASQRFDADRLADRTDFETDEASRLRATQELQALAPLTQALTEQQAGGLLTAGEAQRMLDQRALDTAYGDFQAQAAFPFEMLNFALKSSFLLAKDASAHNAATSPRRRGLICFGIGFPITFSNAPTISNTETPFPRPIFITSKGSKFFMRSIAETCAEAKSTT